MPRTGTRPHTWKVQGELNHEQYLVWLQMKSQAMYRKETFALTFEEFQTLWLGNWERKGRGVNDYCLTREDPEGAWIWGNVSCISRHEHFKRSGRYKKEKRLNGKQKQHLGS
jgi:hypothetical protein